MLTFPGPLDGRNLTHPEPSTESGRPPALRGVALHRSASMLPGEGFTLSTCPKVYVKGEEKGETRTGRFSRVGKHRGNCTNDKLTRWLWVVRGSLRGRVCLCVYR